METNFLMTAFSLTLFVAAVYAGGAAIDNSVKELRKAFLVGLINIILLACGICSERNQQIKNTSPRQNIGTDTASQ